MRLLPQYMDQLSLTESGFPSRPISSVRWMRASGLSGLLENEDVHGPRRAWQTLPGGPFSSADAGHASTATAKGTKATRSFIGRSSAVSGQGPCPLDALQRLR